MGDVLIHRELQKQALADDALGFTALWQPILDLLAEPDITYANLESPMAWGIARDGSLTTDPGKRFDNRVYTGYAKFNIHPSLADALATSGIDVVSTANNHSLDRGALGIDRTLDALDKAKVRHTGTIRQGSHEPWHAVTEAKGLRIAWLACTLHTNFGVDDHHQVLHCFDEADRVSTEIKRLVDDPDIDAVIVTPHWGREYKRSPSERQTSFAKAWVEAGATAIVGSHPHVLEPWEILTAEDGRQAFVLYSLGNFVSHQRSLDRRTTIMLNLGLHRDPTTGRVSVIGARYVPLHVEMEGDKQAFFVESLDRVKEPTEARAWVTELLGAPNHRRPDEPLEVRPHCFPGWSALEASDEPL